MAHRYRHWTILKTKLASSLEAAKHVRAQDFEVYRPLYRPQAKGGSLARDAKQLFEYYLFVQVDLRRKWQVLHATRGVHKLFLCGNTPHEIDDSHVEWIRSCEDASGYFVVQSEEPPVFETDQLVRGVSGMLEDHVGIYKGLGRTARDTRRVLFSLLGREVEFEVKAHDLVAA